MRSITDLADAVEAGRYDRDSGLRFLQRRTSEQKAIYRGKVHGLLRPLIGKRGPLSILTMPSVRWSLERDLINSREHGKGTQRPRRTHITAIESNPAIFRASTLSMPGFADSLAVLNPPAFARETVRTYAIARFHRCSFEELAWGTEDAPDSHRFDVAWIDLCGQLSLRRLDALASLWENRIRTVLVVTSMRGRWEPGLTELVADLGLAGVLTRWLNGATVYNEHSYADGVAMSQIALVREGGSSVGSIREHATTTPTFFLLDSRRECVESGDAIDGQRRTDPTPAFSRMDAS